jgi:hypothetical protein
MPLDEKIVSIDMALVAIRSDCASKGGRRYRIISADDRFIQDN